MGSNYSGLATLDFLCFSEHIQQVPVAAGTGLPEGNICRRQQIFNEISPASRECTCKKKPGMWAKDLQEGMSEILSCTWNLELELILRKRCMTDI